MKVDIWSDIRCPFCYIGKRNFEAALDQFSRKENVQVEWRSFQLDPSLVTQTSENVFDYLARKKGQSREWSVRMHQHVAETAREAGLTYNFNDVVVANSFNAQRLIQLAKTSGLGDAAEERLFRAYFTEGENIDDHETLARLASEIGLEAVQVK
jgi:protein disulfide-isomerase